MATSAAILLSYPASLAVTNLKAQTGVAYSSTSAFLSGLRSFLVSTVGWTLLDTNVSGLAENFVVRSSGASGDRLICAKFGISGANDANLSCFACVSFASATDVASNATANHYLRTTSGTTLVAYFAGTADYCFVGHLAPAVSAGDASWLYVGLCDELVSSVSATPNQTVILTAVSQASVAVGLGQIVESPTGSFAVTVAHDATMGPDFTSILGRTDPDVNTGQVFLFPGLMVNTTTDRVYGWLRGAGGVGLNLAPGAVLTLSGHDYIVFGNPNATGAMLAVRFS